MSNSQQSDFKVYVDLASLPQNPDKAIWNAMHQCKTFNESSLDSLKQTSYAAAVIRNALKFGHWSVLDFASVKVDFINFPHDTAMQWVRHQRASPMCQSMRYSDELFSEVVSGKREVRELFYLPEGWIYTAFAWLGCLMYTLAVKGGLEKEEARRLLPAGYRQNFTISANFRQWMHILDQRLLADTQKEANMAAWMCLEELEKVSDLFVWYRENRAGKNKLAP